jgi:hypothetical protein
MSFPPKADPPIAENPTLSNGVYFRIHDARWMMQDTQYSREDIKRLRLRSLYRLSVTSFGFFTLPLYVTETGIACPPRQAGYHNSNLYPVRRPRHSCLSADRYGGDDINPVSPLVSYVVNKVLIPSRKGRVKAPSFLTGFTIRFSINNYKYFK